MYAYKLKEALYVLFDMDMTYIYSCHHGSASLAKWKGQLSPVKFDRVDWRETDHSDLQLYLKQRTGKIASIPQIGIAKLDQT